MAVTLAACWSAVALSANRSAWTSITAIQIGWLVLFSIGAVACAVALGRSAAALRRATANAPAPGPVAQSMPDWLGDLIGAARILAGHAGPAVGPVMQLLGWADNQVLPLIRRHPIATAAAIGAAFGAAVTISQSVREGYQAGLAVVFFCVTTSGVFAFLVTAGGYLHVVRSGVAAGARAPLIRATVLAAAAVPVALAFRDAFWSLVGASPQDGGLPALSLLLGSAAALVFAASLGAGHLTRSCTPKRRADSS